MSVVTDKVKIEGFAQFMNDVVVKKMAVFLMESFKKTISKIAQ